MNRVLTFALVVLAVGGTPLHAFAQQGANAPTTLAQSASPAVPEASPLFLADLDKALGEGCGSFYKYTGWEKYVSPSLLCVDGSLSSIINGGP